MINVVALAIRDVVLASDIKKSVSQTIAPTTLYRPTNNEHDQLYLDPDEELQKHPCEGVHVQRQVEYTQRLILCPT